MKPHYRIKHVRYKGNDEYYPQVRFLLIWWDVGEIGYFDYSLALEKLQKYHQKYKENHQKKITEFNYINLD